MRAITVAHFFSPLESSLSQFVAVGGRRGVENSLLYYNVELKVLQDLKMLSYIVNNTMPMVEQSFVLQSKVFTYKSKWWKQERFV